MGDGDAHEMARVVSLMIWLSRSKDSTKEIDSGSRIVYLVFELIRRMKFIATTQLTSCLGICDDSILALGTDRRAFSFGTRTNIRRSSQRQPTTTC